MHQAMVDIMTDRILNQFSSEAFFCEHILKIEQTEWDAWKFHQTPLKTEDMQKLMSLFSDYEWMLIQKLMRQTCLFPEKRHYVVSEYKRVKTLIAKKWLQEGNARIELINRTDQSQSEGPQGYKEIFILKVFLQYEVWGYDDCLEFCLPATVQDQIKDSSKGLLEWVNENLEEEYM